LINDIARQQGYLEYDAASASLDDELLQQLLDKSQSGATADRSRPASMGTDPSKTLQRAFESACASPPTGCIHATAHGVE
jgi:hypothetical protein